MPDTSDITSDMDITAHTSEDGRTSSTLSEKTGPSFARDRVVWEWERKAFALQDKIG